MTKKDDALRLRDMAVQVARSSGTMEDVGGVRILVARLEELEIIHTTPFQRMPGPRPPRSFDEAVAHAAYKGQARYAIDVWMHGKVFSVDWDEDQPLEVISFKRGRWEELLLVASAVRAAPPSALCRRASDDSARDASLPRLASRAGMDLAHR